MIDLVSQDEYGTVINTGHTYTGLAKILKTGTPVIMAWTDEEGTQLDILLAIHPAQFGILQRGMKSTTDLFVAVSSFGMFGFEMNNTWKSAGYVGEKLGLGGSNATTIKLADLINDLIEELRKEQ